MTLENNPSPTPARVLIVDDERSLLPLLERYILRLGYQPTCFSDPLPALAAFREAEPPFGLVMTDLTLEGLTGEELAREVLAHDPAVRVVVMSGYPYSTEHFSEEDRPRVTFLQKPFLPSQIRDAVEPPIPVAPAAASEPEELAAETTVEPETKADQP